MRLPTDRVHRRRLTVLALAALAAVAIGVGVGAGGGNDSREPETAAEPAVPALPLEQQVGQLLVMSFDGPAAPGYIRRRLRDGQGAGVILFGRNVSDAGQLRRLTGTLQRAAGGGALIATDQEGGEIRNVPFAGPALPQSAMDSPDAVAAAAAGAARSLRAAGVNVNLAPVADVEPATGGGALPGRLYPGSAAQVADLADAFVRAHDRARVAATVKHYPGLGRATVNTDDGPATIDASREEIERDDLAPYRTAASTRAPLVMAGHALYPAFDSERIASQSKVLLDDVLRGELGYRGAVVTDSIEAQAVLDRSDVATAAIRSIEAGADLVLMTGSGSWNLVYPSVLRRVRRSPAFRARVEESVRRVIALKRRLGLRVGTGRIG